MNVVSMGSLTETLVTGREFFKSAILSNARGVILIHNHPSGNFTPSKEDFLVTTKMCIGGDILGIDVWDHIMVAGGSGERYSMAEQGKSAGVQEQMERGGGVCGRSAISATSEGTTFSGNTCKRYRRNGFVEMLESLLMFG